MQQSLEAMRVALRVLTALNNKVAAAPEDITELRQLAPLLADLPPDELACAVIELALKRARVRKKSNAATQ